MRTALIIYLISHDHSPHTLLSPTARDITHDYEHNFLGLTEEDVAMETLLATRTALVENIASTCLKIIGVFWFPSIDANPIGHC
jgi:hypothetical protein